MSAETLGTLKNQEKLLELRHLSVSCTILLKSKKKNTFLEGSPYGQPVASITEVKYAHTLPTQ
jgi:hypothetical protein